jgi:hypothetical protein
MSGPSKSFTRSDLSRLLPTEVELEGTKNVGKGTRPSAARETCVLRVCVWGWRLSPCLLCSVDPSTQPLVPKIDATKHTRRYWAGKVRSRVGWNCGCGAVRTLHARTPAVARLHARRRRCGSTRVRRRRRARGAAARAPWRRLSVPPPRQQHPCGAVRAVTRATRRCLAAAPRARSQRRLSLQRRPRAGPRALLRGTLSRATP